jgi:hypothetical protein
VPQIVCISPNDHHKWCSFSPAHDPFQPFPQIEEFAPLFAQQTLHSLWITLEKVAEKVLSIDVDIAQ